MAAQVAVQRVQAPAGQVHVLGRLRLVKACQLPRQLGRMGGLNPGLGAAFVKGLQPFVTE